MFYKLSWNGQLLAATTLFVISFLIEAEVLRRFLDDPLLAYPLAAALELSKALTIVLGRYFKSRGGLEYPVMVRAVQGTFRVGLVVLSFAAAAIYFASWADRPNLESVRAADLALAGERHQRASVELERRFDGRREQLAASLAARRVDALAATERDYGEAIAELERRLAREMGVVDRHGNFKGRRYRELERRLEETRAAYQARLDALSREHAAAADEALGALERERGEALDGLVQSARSEERALREAGYEADGRAYDPLVTSAVAMADEVLGVAVSPLQFTFAMAILVSLLTELGIWAGLEIVALSFMPIFEAEAHAARAVGRKRVETEAELDLFRMDDAVLREKARMKAESIERSLRERPDDEAA